MPASRASIQAALRDPASFGTTLLMAVAGSYGVDNIGRGWLPETLLAEIKDDFHVELSSSAASKLIAAATILTSDRFFKNLPDFVDLANAINGAGFDPTSFDPVSAEEACWAITEAVFLLRSCLDSVPVDEMEFSDEIRGYLGAALDAEGIVDPPDVLRVAERDRDRMGRVLGDFSDDPATFDAIYSAERDKSREIESEVENRMNALLGQLSALLNISRSQLNSVMGNGPAGRTKANPLDSLFS